MGMGVRSKSQGGHRKMRERKEQTSLEGNATKGKWREKAEIIRQSNREKLGREKWFPLLLCVLAHTLSGIHSLIPAHFPVSS
jgi:hypothetical protein